MLAIILWYFYPDIDTHSDFFVTLFLSIIQIAIIPNVFLSIIKAITTLSADHLMMLSKRFLYAVSFLWGIVIALLLMIWFVISTFSGGQTVLATFSASKLGITFLVPGAMLLALIVGGILNYLPSGKRMIPSIHRVQFIASVILEYVFLLIPILVFFVVHKFLSVASFKHTAIALHYFLLSLTFVSCMIVLVFPLIYRYLVEMRYSNYIKLIAPICFMTFLAGDSIASIPLIAKAVDEQLPGDAQSSRMLTIVVICFPWVGELANLIFPIYSSVIEGFGFTTVLSIVSVGPFFMFTDPYISIPTLLGAFNFPETYQFTYLTLALMTDHMFEVCESVSVLLVVLILRTYMLRVSRQVTN